VGSETIDSISAIEPVGDYVFVATGTRVLGYHRGKQVVSLPELNAKVTKLLHLSTMMLAVTSTPAQLHVLHIPQQELVRTLDLQEGGHVTAMLHPATWLNKVVLGRESGIVQIWNIRIGYRLLFAWLTQETDLRNGIIWQRRHGPRAISCVRCHCNWSSFRENSCSKFTHRHGHPDILTT
jgi:hypothetical protein